MAPSPNRALRSHSALLVALQATLLTSWLALSPAIVIAQDSPAEPAAEQTEPAPEAAPEAAPEPQPGLFIASDPRKLRLIVGETARLAAFVCPLPAPDLSPFGPDDEPATADDTCMPA